MPKSEFHAQAGPIKVGFFISGAMVNQNLTIQIKIVKVVGTTRISLLTVHASYLMDNSHKEDCLFVEVEPNCKCYTNCKLSHPNNDSEMSFAPCPQVRTVRMAKGTTPYFITTASGCATVDHTHTLISLSTEAVSRRPVTAMQVTWLGH